MTRRLPAIRSLVLAAACFGVAAAARGQIIETPETKIIPRLTVQGEAELRKPADELQITVGVVNENPEAAVALAENLRKMQAIVIALGKAGLTDDEYETGRFQLRPTYSRRPRNANANWRPEINGYAVSNTLNIRTTRLDLAGRIIETANAAGANSIENIRFDLSNPRAYRDEAITAATRNALEDARTLAGAAGLKLMRILSVTLDGATARPPAPSPSYARGMAAEAVSAAPPISPGDVTIRANVMVVYEIAEEKK